MTNARKHLDFLKSIHEYYGTLNDQKCNKTGHESLRRYQELWLPLVAAVETKTNRETPPSLPTTKVQLYPPPDIAWLWHCHRLAPKHYTKHCHHAFNGRILEAHPPFEMAHPINTTSLQDQASSSGGCYYQVTLDLWTEMYPYESFFLVKNGTGSGLSSLPPEASMESESSSSQRLLHGFDIDRKSVV